MLPTVTCLSSIGSYRDGGSLGITFDGEEKYWYELFFKVKLQRNLDARGHTIDVNKLGYLQPILKINTPSEWTSKITSVTHTEYKQSEQVVSWEDAKQLLETIEYLVESFEMEGELSEYYDREEGLSIYQEMLDTARNSGAISN